MLDDLYSKELVVYSKAIFADSDEAVQVIQVNCPPDSD